MPNLPSVPDVDNIYLCTTVDLPDPEITFYAVGFDPHSKKKNVHHLTVYGCQDTVGGKPYENEDLLCQKNPDLVFSLCFLC